MASVVFRHAIWDSLGLVGLEVEQRPSFADVPTGLIVIEGLNAQRQAVDVIHRVATQGPFEAVGQVHVVELELDYGSLAVRLLGGDHKHGSGLATEITLNAGYRS